VVARVRVVRVAPVVARVVRARMVRARVVRVAPVVARVRVVRERVAPVVPVARVGADWRVAPDWSARARDVERRRWRRSRRTGDGTKNGA
jgi:hypothetical protein